MNMQEDFNQYINGFMKLLERVNPGTVSAEPYCLRYLDHLLRHKKYYLSIYADLLNKLMLHASKNKQEMLLIDYGAGNGLLGLFAKYSGFGRVALNDLDEKFIQSAQRIALQLGIHADHYITGSIESLLNTSFGQKPDAVIGTDVIEHIYNLDDFFDGIRKLNPAMVSVFTTASNPVNPFKVKALQEIQRKDELEGGMPSDHALFGETAHLPFLKIREQIILQNFKDGKEEDILALAKATRGLKQEDIIKAIEEFRRSAALPNPAQGTNTCNPLNGSWTERIGSLDEYRALYKRSGFTCDFFPGFYNDKEGGADALVKKILNIIIPFSGNRISPYIVLLGYPS